MKISELIKKFPEEKDMEVLSRPYFNHSIEFKNIFTPQERAEMLETACLNVFFFPSEMISGCDLLSDSGTTTMTNEQWAALHLGDEAFGSYDKKMKKEVLPEFNFVRFAIPRLRYEKRDLDSVAEAVEVLYEDRDKIPSVRVTYGRELPMRHFKARFEFRK